MMDIISRGFRYDEVMKLTIRQVMLFQKAGLQYDNFKRISTISDMRVASGNIDEQDATRHINHLRYG
jgi:hypothetical protein